MTVKIDGTNGLLQSYDYQVLTTGFTYTFAAGTQVLVAVPAATLATGTITMPSAPADGMVITIQSTQQITALTLNGNTGQTVVGTAVQIVPNQPLSWVYRLTNTTWYPMAGGAGRASPLVIGTSVASTSGSSISFTSIPSWAKRISVLFSGVSLSATANILVQVGSGSTTSTGYVGYYFLQQTSGTPAVTSATDGFRIQVNTNASTAHGKLSIDLITGTTYVASGTFVGLTATSIATFLSTGGTIALSGVLDRVVITSTSTDTFDAGSINIQYE
jgi:hypothetical protein